MEKEIIENIDFNSFKESLDETFWHKTPFNKNDYTNKKKLFEDVLKYFANNFKNFVMLNIKESNLKVYDVEDFKEKTPILIELKKL